MQENNYIHEAGTSGRNSGFSSDLTPTKLELNFDDVWERIRQLTGWKKYGDLADYLRIKSQSVSGVKKRGIMPIDWAYKVASGYNGSTDWLLTGAGPMRRFKGEAQRAAEGEYGFEQRPKGLAQRLNEHGGEAVEETPLQVSAHAAFDALNAVEGMGLLTKIYTSGDIVFIRAINANLMAFSDAIENRSRAETTINAIREMREQMNIMQGDLAALRQENQELQRKLLSRGDREQKESAG